MITIRKAADDDVEAIVKMHEEAFPEYFSSTLGERFIRVYYGCVCKSDAAVMLCAEE